jgi:hypothetical protein
VEPEVCGAHVEPSGDVTTTPPSPVITNWVPVQVTERKVANTPELRSVQNVPLVEVKAFTAGVPGLPSREGIKEVLEYEIKAPLKLDREVPEDSVMNLKFIEEVRAEFEGRKGIQ